MVNLPFHCLTVRQDTLFAARGSWLHTFDLNGRHLSSTDLATAVITAKAQDGDDVDVDAPPAKRLKVALDDGSRVEGSLAVEDLGHDGQKPASNGTKSNGSSKQATGNGAKQRRLAEIVMINLLDTTTDGQYIVASTSDKAVHVLTHDGNGNLKVSSRRIMPKRPSSIVMDQDSNTIFAADKFGDVYALPLDTSSTDGWAYRTNTLSAAKKRAHRLQADETTVHTKQNLLALAEQRRQKSDATAGPGAATPVSVPSTAETEASTVQDQTPAFEWTLLLGHVSMITSLLHTQDPSNPARSYLITSDRDEHIRVSRAKPGQTHIIERFCLGHTQFISRLLMSDKFPNILISGGGDSWLGIWDWTTGKLLNSSQILGDRHIQDLATSKMAVTGLWEVAADEPGKTRFVATFERSFGLFTVTINEQGEAISLDNMGLPASLLDIVILDASKATLLVALDVRTLKPEDTAKYASGIAKITLPEKKIEPVPLQEGPTSSATDIDLTHEDLDGLLYTTEALRKQELDHSAAGE